VRRGAASCRAALRSCTSHRGGRCRHRKPSWAAECRRRCNPSQVAPPSRRSPSSWPSRMSGRQPHRSLLCPPPLSAVRTSVHLAGADVRCPRGRCDPGVRTDRRRVSTRPVRPRCPHRAGPAMRRVRRDRPVWRTGFDVSLSTADVGRRFARVGCGAALAAWASRQLVQRQAAGRLAGTQGRSRRPQVPSQVRLGQVAGVMPGPWGLGPGGGYHAAWSLSGVLVSYRSGPWRPVRCSGSSLRPQHGRRRGGELSARSWQRADQREQWWARQGLNL
jgi:hypothetical protein